MTDMHQYAERTHQEVLDLVSSFSDGTSSDRASSISQVLSMSHNSSNSLSLLPSQPQIFYGRDYEISAIIQNFHREAPKIAILGAGGMGKTSLARAVLHHPEIYTRYGPNRLFVTCETTSTSVQLAALIGAHIGLNPGKDLTGPVIRHFTNGPPSLLVLDNLETIWEPMTSRRDIEQFLSLLTGIDDLALIITMRGAERPANVRWTHPFLPPLRSLTQDAARQTFIDITDEGYNHEDIDRILLLADNMPLAINLIAHVVDSGGLSSVLDRWETERTSLLSDGYDKESNLDLSISLSIESPRLASLPNSLDLLSLLSILPDGLSDVDLIQSKLPIENILGCKAALLQTALAYTDDQKRLKTLVPIREYVYKMYPPMNHLVQPVLKHFNKL
ncbi:P-loop containing nucleoside triphosphate hydrolase protein, partial [Mycena vulgaris]